MAQYDSAGADAAGPGPGEDRILTLPNAVTVARLLCVPVFLWLLFGHHPHDRYHAALLLAVLGTTDWVDGYLARHLHQVSTVGKILDPIADRILLGVGVLAILIDGSVPVWLGVTVLAREVLVGGAVVLLALAGARRLDVQWAGKAGTCGMMLAFPLFLVGHSSVGWRHPAEALAWTCAVPGLAFSLYAAVTYVPMARRALTEGRGARVGRPAAGPSLIPPQESHS
jgi:cardiolipin synthase (CMP-forming)